MVCGLGVASKGVTGELSAALLCIFSAVLKGGLTDEGLRALAAAGCGQKLMSLTLEGEVLCVFFLAVCLVCVGVTFSLYFFSFANGQLLERE